MATKISRTSVFDAIDALFENDLQLDGHVGIGRAASEVPLHVGASTVDATPLTVVQVDAVVEGGVGGTHVGLEGNARATAGWDGTGGQLFGGTFEASTSGTGTGELFGFQAHAKVLVGAGPGNEACGGEIDVVTEDPVTTRSGLFIGAMPGSLHPTREGHQASGLDSLIVLTNKEYGAPWKAGITFLQASPTLSRFPIAPNGTLVTATPSESATVTNGIDFSSPYLTFSGHSLKVPGFAVSGAGVLEMSNGVEPTTSPADTVQLFSADYSGSATLGLRTETAVVTESVTSNRTLRIKVNGTVYKLCLKA